MRRLHLLLIFCVTAALIFDGCQFSKGDGLTHPSPELGASQALNLQLEALRLTGSTHRGLAQMYAFASPKSREMVGSFNGFAELILNHLTPLVGHRYSRVEVLEENKTRLRFQVTVGSSDGTESHYEWVLENIPTPDCSFCWHNTFIHPMDLPEKAATIEL